MFGSATVILSTVDGASSGVLGAFGVHWQLLLIQALNFLCVVAILYFFAFKPILKTMEERKSKIENGLKYAEEMRVQLESSEAVIRERLSQAKEEARRILEDAKQQAKVYGDRQRAEMEQLANGMIEAAKRNVAEEKTRMMRDLRGEVKALVIDAAAKVLAKELSAVERKRYLSEVEIHL
ncbi:MAG: F0F1 ATP synthase subunit B [Puniceicoccales bacterium]|jgi:F-type H+-transporting ATPase subunit b|nr:F0F1 ATP synthase subunit B [Puniceicoccales bacterium]